MKTFAKIIVTRMPDTLHFPAFAAVRCGHMTKSFPMPASVKLICALKKVGMTPPCSYLSLPVIQNTDEPVTPAETMKMIILGDGRERGWKGPALCWCGAELLAHLECPPWTVM